MSTKSHIIEEWLRKTETSSRNEFEVDRNFQFFERIWNIQREEWDCILGPQKLWLENDEIYIGGVPFGRYLHMQPVCESIIDGLGPHHQTVRRPILHPMEACALRKLNESGLLIIPKRYELNEFGRPRFIRCSQRTYSDANGSRYSICLSFRAGVWTLDKEPLRLSNEENEGTPPFNSIANPVAV